MRYKDLFEGLGTLAGDVHLDVDPTVKPVQMPLRRLPIPIKDKVQCELQQMCQDGIIEPVSEPSPWISALLVVAKPDGRVRICIDPKPLNKALKRSHYPMQTIEDVLPQLANAKVFSTVDAKNGFWALKLDKESSKLTTFETPFGRYRWLRLPFGVSPAPELFQARMHEALRGLNGVACIADDILISGSGADMDEAQRDHDCNLIQLLERCRSEGLKLNKDKLQLNRTTTNYMGYLLTANGLLPDPKKVDAIRQMPPPTDRQGVLRLLGMATFLGKFCPNFSEVTAKIRELLPKTAEFRWDETTHGIAFKKLKDLLSAAPVLQYYDVTKPTVIQCDSSQNGIGAVTLQDGKPVEYASRAMTKTERDSYAQIEKELLAIVFSMNRFHSYVYGKRVTVETDHKPLISIVKKSLSSAPKRLQRMLLQLQRYDFELVYRPGTQMVVADTLSRAFPPAVVETNEFSEELAALCDDQQHEELRMVASPRTINIIKNAAAGDEQYQQLIRQIVDGWPASPADIPADLQEYATFCDELIVSNGLIFKGQRVVIPHSARAEILERLHSSHIGVNGCIRRAREAVYYPGITADIKKKVGNCDICQRHQQACQKEPLLSHPAPSRPWEKVGVDIFTFCEHDYLITTDYLSGYFEIDRLPSKRVSDIVYCLKQHFARHGLPSEVQSDNSPFNSAEFRRFAELYDFVHNTSSPYYPQSNGKVENSVKTAKRLMAKAVASSCDPFIALLDWRNTPSEQLHQSPAQIMFGRRTRTRLPSTDCLLSTPGATVAQQALTTAKARQASYYNTNARERPPLTVGQTVRTRFNDETNWRKAEVAKVLPYRSYELSFDDGTQRRRTSKHVRFSSEPPLLLGDVVDDPPLAAATQPAVAVPPSTACQQQPLQPPVAPQTMTRAGRIIRKPTRYKDFV
jgi:hypothetical protein